MDEWGWEEGRSTRNRSSVSHLCGAVPRPCPGSSLPTMEVRSITKLAYYNIWKLRFREPSGPGKIIKVNPFFNVLHICVQPFCLKHWIQQQT